MKRDLQRLATATFDAIVAGGGVYGLTIAHELSRGGMTVCLMERDDFAAATSFNSLKTLHGGVRELQQGALARVREFVRERREIARLAPHLVRVLPFVIPTSRRHPRPLMRAFLAGYDLLARDRNDGVDPARQLPGSRVISRAECLDLNPLIDEHGVTGGAVWHDYQLHSPERFAMALVESMVKREAAAINYTEVLTILRSGGVISGVRARDRLTGDALDVRAPVVINAAGPWTPAILGRADTSLPTDRRPGWSLAMNLVVDVPALSCAVGGLADGRFLFLVPWRDGSIAGTSHGSAPDGGGAAEINERKVEAFLTDVKTAFPQAGLSRDSIRLVHRGLLPTPAGSRGHSALLKDSIVHDHGGDGIPGLFTVVGSRYTTAGATARAVAALVHRARGRRPGNAGDQRLAAADMGHVEDFIRQSELSRGAGAMLVRRLITTYGTGFRAVSQLMEERPALAAPLGSACQVTGAEIVRAAREEMAVTLADALIRRTGAGAGGHPGRDAARAAASIMAAELGWSAAHVDRELAALDAFYVIAET
jgi:glycerol-3-phosphate dehydrogenase